MSDHTAPIKPLNQLARIEPATLDDLPKLVDLLLTLFQIEEDFQPDRALQEKGLRLILEQPSRGRIFVVRTDYEIIGMVNCLFTISTAMGGFVVLLEDLIINTEFQRQHYGTQLIQYVVDYAKKKDFKRITLLTDKLSEDSQKFFVNFGFEHSKMIPMRLNLEV
ncbi:MAG: GNAT family N-acetyltransferase [Verrucomicrobiales bacterium]|nr:GNAT family N-acetyltransferase [Verrucomicrobiales bacterium]